MLTKQRYSRVRGYGLTAFRGLAAAPLELRMTEFLLQLFEDLTQQVELCDVDTGFMPEGAYFATRLPHLVWVPWLRDCRYWWKKGGELYG